MKTINLLRIACVALLLWAVLPSAQAQGIRVHYKNGTTTDIPAALFDHLSPYIVAGSQAVYSYIIYKTDGSQLKVAQDELDYIEAYAPAFDDRITQQIPQEYLSKMAAHMPIYNGNRPPTVDGSFVIHPLKLIYSSDGYMDDKFNDIYMKFSEQDASKNTLQYQEKQSNSTGDKTEMILLGEGDNFTVFAVVTSAMNGGKVTYSLATIISGTMTADGIKDCYQAVLMVDKNDPNNEVMDVGTYRIFKDGDLLATPQSWSARSAVREQTGLSSVAAKTGDTPTD